MARSTVLPSCTPSLCSEQGEAALPNQAFGFSLQQKAFALALMELPRGQVRQSWADRIGALGPCWCPVQPTKAFRTLERRMFFAARASCRHKLAVYSTGLWADLTLRLCWWQMRTRLWDAPSPCTLGRSWEGPGEQQHSTVAPGQPCALRAVALGEVQCE